MTEQKAPSKVAYDFLIRGKDHAAAAADFELIGREAELNAAMDVLLRKNAGNNLVLVGSPGVGISSIVTGLQKAKEKAGTPFDIAGKEFFYLDVDALFGSNDYTAIEKGFGQALETLEKSQDAVLVIDDAKGFLDGVRNSNNNNIVNALMRATRTNPRLQVIFEAANDDLGSLLKAHSDITKIFTIQSVGRPTDDDQKAVVENAAKKLEEQYGVSISQKAVDTVLSLTKKYPGIASKMNAAQPKCAIVLLEGAMTAYCRSAHAKPAGMDELEKTLETVTTALEKRQPAEGDLADKSPEELAAIQAETEASINELNEQWEESQKEIRALLADRSKSDEYIQDINASIAEIKQKAQEKTASAEAAREALAAAAGDKSAIGKIRDEYKNKYHEDLVETPDAKSGFTKALGGIASNPEVRALEDERRQYEKLAKENREKYAELTANINDGLELGEEHVLSEFSRISKIDMSKLKQDDTEKLMRLEETIEKRVFGQDEAAKTVSKAVRRGKAGLKKPNKPIGTFLFLGPTGVGKTEMAKAVTEALYGDEKLLHVYNMPEYSEKNAITKLIGSPPGYEGYEQGGQLTNDMMNEPSCVNLFDEAEKAHVDAFDILLRIADEGRLQDNHGREVFFGDSINIITSNLGAKYFLDENLSFEEAKKLAEDDLIRHKDPNDPNKEIGFRPEFLKRLDKVICFNRLDDGQIVLVAMKSLKELNGWLAEEGKISVEMPEDDLKAMCKDNYVPEDGARGVMHYIADTITSDVSDTVLRNPGKNGVVKVSYSSGGEGEGKITTQFVPEKPAAQAAAAADKKKPNGAPKL